MLVPQSNMDTGIAAEDMSHEPLRLFSEIFHESQFRRFTVDRDRFAIVSICTRLQYLRQGGVRVYRSH